MARAHEDTEAGPNPPATASGRGPRRRRGGRGLLAVALCLVITGCGSAGTSRRASTATTTPTTIPATPPQPSEQCGAPATRATSFWLAGPDRARLQAATLGTGPDAAVFVHESGNQGLCGFWPYAAWLVQTRHVRAVLFDQCGYGASVCQGGPATDGDKWVAATKAAVAWARDHGVRRVTLVGASVGGIAVLHAAASVRPRVDAVVDLSGELSAAGMDSLPAARRLELPALFAVAPDDPYVSVAKMRRVYEATSARPRRLVVLPDGSGHGWDMLTGTAGSQWSPLASTVAAWVQGRYR